jgi:hypothetical protein
MKDYGRSRGTKSMPMLKWVKKYNFQRDFHLNIRRYLRKKKHRISLPFGCKAAHKTMILQ